MRWEAGGMGDEEGTAVHVSGIDCYFFRHALREPGTTTHLLGSNRYWDFGFSVEGRSLEKQFVKQKKGKEIC